MVVQIVTILRPVVADNLFALRYSQRFWNISGLAQVRSLTSDGIDIGFQWRRTLSRQSLGECRKVRATRTSSSPGRRSGFCAWRNLSVSQAWKPGLRRAKPDLCV